MIQTLLDMRFEITTVILFCSGFMTLLLHPNLIKKIIGMNIMDTAIFLFLAADGYVQGAMAPIVEGLNADPTLYINPVPSGLVLTGIVVSVSTTAFFLALTVRLYKKIQLAESGHDPAAGEEREGLMLPFYQNLPFSASSWPCWQASRRRCSERITWPTG